MKTILFVLASLAYCAANPLATNGRAEKLKMFAEMAEEVNSQQLGWAANPDYEFTYQVNEIFSQSYCDHRLSKTLQLQPMSAEEEEEANKLPKNFDARKQWPQCKSIGHIRDQSSCGSCWAFGSVEAMTDRICVKSNGTKNPILSAAHLAACDENDSGCHGGHLETAYDYYQDKGIVTGGDFNSSEGCWPYPYKHCKSGVVIPGCPPHGFPDIKCQKECPNKKYKEHKLSDDKHFGQDYYKLSDEKKIMLDIYKNGPVTGGFTVYRDFMGYRHGVYVAKKNQPVAGYHAIKILGWGEEDGKKYWLIGNSWGTEWGDKGFIKMKKGTCNLEDMIVASLPKTK